MKLTIDSPVVLKAIRRHYSCKPVKPGGIELKLKSKNVAKLDVEKFSHQLYLLARHLEQKSKAPNTGYRSYVTRDLTPTNGAEFILLDNAIRVKCKGTAAKPVIQFSW